MSENNSPEETKLIYHIDEEPTPYLIKLNISPDSVTLGDFKTALNKPNFKYFVKSKDDDFGFVKEEILGDSSKLPCFNGKIVIWLVTSNDNQDLNEEDVNSTSSATKSRPPSFYTNSTKKINQKSTKNSSDQEQDSDQLFNDSESVQSAGQDKIAPLKSFKTYKSIGGRYSRISAYDTTSSMLSSDIDSTVIYDSEDESRMSTATGTTLSSVYACQPGNFMKKRSKHYLKRFKKAPTLSRASSFSSITDSTMSLNIVSVTLPMDTVTFLGISIVGQSNKASGDSGIYVGSIMKGGAVAQDGRIDPGDMLLEVNGISFEEMSNDDAVKTLRDQVQRSGPITLVVAKCWDGFMNEGQLKQTEINEYSFTLPRNEPVLPIDPRAWVLHNNAMLMSDNLSMSEMPVNNNNNCGASVITAGGESNGSLPMGASASMFMNGQYQNQSKNKASSLSESLPENGCKRSENGASRYCPIDCCTPLCVKSDLHCIIRAMRHSESSLEIKDRIWLKIIIPNAFIGSDLVDWLYNHVEGFSDHKEAKRFASELLKFGFIRHTVNKNSFSEQCYYVFSDLPNDYMHSGAFHEPFDGVSLRQQNPGQQNSNEHWRSAEEGHQRFSSNNMIRVGSTSSCGQYSSVQSPNYPTPSTLSSGIVMATPNNYPGSNNNDTQHVHMSTSQIKHLANDNDSSAQFPISHHNFNTMASRVSLSASSSGSSSRRFFSSCSKKNLMTSSNHMNCTPMKQQQQALGHNGQPNYNQMNRQNTKNGHEASTDSQSNDGQNNNPDQNGNFTHFSNLNSTNRQQLTNGLTNLTFNGSNTSSTQRTITSNQTIITTATNCLENSFGLLSVGNNSCSPTASSDALDFRSNNFKSPPPQPPPRLTPMANQV